MHLCTNLYCKCVLLLGLFSCFLEVSKLRLTALRERGREEGRKGRREGGREGEKKGKKEESEGGREGGKERGREPQRERWWEGTEKVNVLPLTFSRACASSNTSAGLGWEEKHWWNALMSSRPATSSNLTFL